MFTLKTLPSENSSQASGLWDMDDVEKPSSEVGGNGQQELMNFSTAKQDDYGDYLDIKMKMKQPAKSVF